MTASDIDDGPGGHEELHQRTAMRVTSFKSLMLMNAAPQPSAEKTGMIHLDL